MQFCLRFAVLSGVAWQPVCAQTAAPASTQETFDTGTKTDYAPGTVALASGSWTFTDAVLGADAAD
ncbi:MAG: hypothetical protein EOO63_08430, partial [Hymenobacter sp.]